MRHLFLRNGFNDFDDLQRILCRVIDVTAGRFFKFIYLFTQFTNLGGLVVDICQNHGRNIDA